MNKLHLLIMGGLATLASCASEDVINSGDINAPSSEGQAMTFGMLTGNHSRATEAMVAAGHTDFGVFAYKGTSLVMDNYWVKYSDSETGSGSTWGDGSNAVNGKSYWFYEGVVSHKQDGTGQTQILKYWDYSFDNHTFVAYTPYNNTTTSVTMYGSNNLHILGANSFWKMTDRDNNEAMYATSNVAKANYGKDVALTFKHLNAVIYLAFKSNVPGYEITLIALVPPAITVGSVTTNATRGVMLTPATATEAGATINWTSGSEAHQQGGGVQQYASKANFTITDVFGTATKSTAVTEAATAPIQFLLNENNSDTSLPINNSGYTKLTSQFFALPLTSTSDYVDGTHMFATGYTLHVSYVLGPIDGAANTTVYDARVFIPADKCRWEYGKSYTYNFTITTGSTGVTDPNTPVYDDGSNQSPYVDPTDPRVPNKGALVPIVFDGVTVSDYTAADNYEQNIK